MSSWVTDLIEQGGYWAIALLMALENIFPPIPSELIMGLGGVGVGQGTFHPAWLVLVGTIGSVIGNFVGGYFGFGGSIQEFSIIGLFTAFVGAVVLLLILNLIQRGRVR